MELIEHLGGTADPAAPASASQLVLLLRRELRRGLTAVEGARAGYDRPIVVPVAALSSALAVVLPVPARLRADISVASGHPRMLVLAAAALDAILMASDQRGDRSALVASYGAWEDALVVAVPWPRAAAPSESDAELAALGIEEHLGGVDRLRLVAAAVPAGVAAILEPTLDLESAIGHRHPLDVMEILLRAGLPPTEAAAAGLGEVSSRGVQEPSPMSSILDAALGPRSGGHRPHEDPDPARRIARRILQMLQGKRKWSGGTGAGYHTEITHLTRGFEQRERDLAGEVVAALLQAGLLVEKVSVGQHHVSLLSRRAADISALVERGELPPDLHLPIGRP